ncbi:hypothetical protein EV174_005527, partial [Coemansia sp. RSA 2320]
MATDLSEPVVEAPAAPAAPAPAAGKPASAKWTGKRARAFSSPTIYAPNLPYECGGAREFNSYVLYALVAGIPYLFKRLLCLSLSSYFILTAVLALPIGALSLVVHSWIVSPPTEQICALPNEPLDAYITILDKELKAKYHAGSKIPME